MSVVTSSKRPSLSVDAVGLRSITVVGANLVLQGIVLFVCAGTLLWPACWALLGATLLISVCCTLYLSARSAGLMAERQRQPKGVEPFDRLFQRIYLATGIVTLAVAGFDHRLEWSGCVHWILPAFGLAVRILALALAYWVLAVNQFAARFVYLQHQRAQTVVMAGPYRLVRHPMYVSFILSWLAIPAALGSWWAYVPALTGVGLYVYRTAREDAFLHGSLDGYSDYAQRVRYRLVPGVW
jgi:protein-S-isoprenylcysteine O-methyltransferase Ste14